MQLGRMLEDASGTVAVGSQITVGHSRIVHLVKIGARITSLTLVLQPVSTDDPLDLILGLKLKQRPSSSYHWLLCGLVRGRSRLEIKLNVIHER